MKKGIALILAIWVVSIGPAIAGQKPTEAASRPSASNITVRPNVLGPLVEGQNIKLMLTDGTYVEGRVLAATEAELRMKVKHAEPEGRIKKGDSNIPTLDVSVVHVKKSGPIVLPIILSVAGGLGGLLAGSYAGYMADSEGACVGLGMGLAAAGATGGAYLGVEAAKSMVTIYVTTPKVPGAEGEGYTAKE